MPVTEGATPFPPIGYAAWRAGVEANLGADAVTRRLRATTEDGMGIEPLYAAGGPGDEQARTLADRVVGLLPEAGQGWRIRQRFPVTASRNTLDAAIAGGVQSLEFTWTDIVELVRLFGIVPELGRAGIEVSLEGNFLRSLLGVGVDISRLGPFSLGIDPVASFLRGDSATGVLVQDTGMLGLVSQWRRPGSLLLRASGDGFFDAGATTGMTLGLTLAVALAYLRAQDDAEVDLSAAASTIEVRLPCGPRFFESAAMLRAARLVWSRILELSGIAVAPLRLVAITGRRTLTRHDPWNNALRNSAVAFAAAVGGADVLQLLPHDSRTTTPGDAALRLARTTGLILREEASLGRVMDPAEGSWFMASLTASLAEEAWEELRRLDAAGGIIAAIDAGDLSRRIADAASARHERVMDKRHPIIGVSEYPVTGEVARRSQEEIVEAAAGGLLPFRPDALPYEVLRDGEVVR
jgi:methylmalonyl-CoA mutase